MSRNFDSSNDYIEKTDSSSLDITSNLTLCTWIRRINDTPTNNEGIAAKYRSQPGSENQRAYEIYRSTTNTIGAAISLDGTGGANIRVIEGATVVAATTWTFVAVVYIPSTSLAVYLGTSPSSIIEDAINTTDIFASIADTAAPFWIGTQFDSTFAGGFFGGLVAHVQLFASSLSLNQLKQVAAFPGSIQNSLRGYWPLWGTSSPEPDYSGNRNNGTVTGATFSGLNPPVGRNFFYPKQRYLWIPSTAGGQTYTVNLSETITWTDSRSYDLLKHLTENYTFTEGLTKNLLKHLTELITFVEDELISISGFVSIALSENWTWTDSRSFNLLKHLTENYTFTESQGKNFLKNLSEAITISESITKNLLKHLSESWTWNDSVTAQIIIVQASLAKLLTFIRRGMIGQNDKQSMETDLIHTGLSKLDSDIMRGDTDEIGWDSHEGI